MPRNRPYHHYKKKERTMTELEIRAAFEAWVVTLNYCVDRFKEGHEYAGNYCFIDVHLAWMAWYRATLAAEAKTDGA